MSDAIVVLNAGSSSLRFALFALNGAAGSDSLDGPAHEVAGGS